MQVGWEGTLISRCSCFPSFFESVNFSWGVVFEEITRYSIQDLSVRVSFFLSVCRECGVIEKWISLCYVASSVA
jgi:hypothetical protein